MAESKLLIHAIHDALVVNFRDSSLIDSILIEAIGKELYALVDEKAVRKLVLDFSSVNFLASQAIGVLITVRKKAKAIKGEVGICCLKPELARVFEIMNLKKLFSFHESEKAALDAMGVYT